MRGVTMRCSGGRIAGLSRAMRCALYLRGGFRCCYCAEMLVIGAALGNPRAATIDHVRPVHRGGRTVPRNLVPACARCNCAKAGVAWGRRPLPEQCRRPVDLKAGARLARFLYPRRGNVAGERPTELYGISVNVRSADGARVPCRDGRGAGTAGQSPWSAEARS